MDLSPHQICPYCQAAVDEYNAEREPEINEVECSSCGEYYAVTPVYMFQGFRIEKICWECDEPESTCTCQLKSGK